MSQQQSDISKRQFLDELLKGLSGHVPSSRRSVEKLAIQYGITDRTLVKEYTELALVTFARNIALGKGSNEEKFQSIVELYNRQVNLSHRTSQSILLQQYSTPAPIAFLAGLFTGAHNDVSVFEPSAGNGLLTIAAHPDRVVVNEIDEVRRSNLEHQRFKQVMKQDASLPFESLEKHFDVVITNPPFGRLSVPVKKGSFSIEMLDHLMAIRALDTMKDTGRAAFIIGGHTRYDKKGRIQKGAHRFFLNYIYSHYHVRDVIPIDGHKLYSRQGTSFDTRLILIAGRKLIASGAAPTFIAERDSKINSFENLYERVMKAKTNAEAYGSVSPSLEDVAAKLATELNLLNFDELGMPYSPASNSCIVLDTVVPDSMGYETHEALRKIKEAIGGDIDQYVCEKLVYSSKDVLCKCLSAEQIDAVAMAIYNIEERGQGMIIGDQTGIGKGRIAAAVIRYAVEQGLQPIFITEKANLFSDLYRDLSAIGSGHLVPFIVNGKESKTDVKDEEGNVVHEALPASRQNEIFASEQVPQEYQFLLATYSQFNSPDKKPLKPAFLRAIAQGNIVIMDEAHNSSGAGNTGSFMQSAIAEAYGVVFLSATFAKRPDNMPIYALKTSIQDASLTKEGLIDAVSKGGVALQEILASQLVAEGQMIRRERSFEGVEVNYITLDEKEREHKASADNITAIMRDIIKFQNVYIDKMVDELDDLAIEDGKQVELREGTSKAGVDNLPYFSKVFQVIHQMLFSIKAESVAERAIARLKEGKKPVIAFSSTMGSFIEQMESEGGHPASDGEVINADFSIVLQKGLEGVLRYTVTDADGQKEFKSFAITDFPLEAQQEYFRISDSIQKASTGITISPIDIIIEKIKSAGYRVSEVTGRKYELQFNGVGKQAVVALRKRINTNDAFRQFNNNETDVLLINQSGSTGASAHAIVTPKVSSSEVRQRVMIVLQAELDINTEVQKRGRINRTGQIFKPIYDYVNSAIPAEKRLMMMLQKKLKSLDANTTSNQKSSTKILDVSDFLNKYGDRIVGEYLKENPEVNILLGDPLGLDENKEEGVAIEDAAHKVSGRVAVLSTEMQQNFYNDVAVRYQEYIEYLKQTGEYDLEVEAMDLQAETISTQTVIIGKGGTSTFGEDSMLEKVMANVLRKPFSKQELAALLIESLQGRTAEDVQAEIIHNYEAFASEQLRIEIEKNELYYKARLAEISTDKKLLKVRDKDGEASFDQATEKATEEIKQALQAANTRIQKVAENRSIYLKLILSSFYPGRLLDFPQTATGEVVPAVFLGFMIDTKKKNPYAPSAIRLRFALANGNKYIALPGNYAQDIRAIIGASIHKPRLQQSDLLNHWEDVIKDSIVNRKTRHIITGNVLQAFGIFSGKLVSYTTIEGGVKKGILMPESWQAPAEHTQSVVVPIMRGIKIIKSLIPGASITTKGGVSFFRTSEKFKIIVSASRSKGGDVYLEKDLLKIVDNHNFEKVSDKMIATFPIGLLNKVVAVFQDKFSDSLSLKQHQFELINGDHAEVSQLQKILPKITLARSFADRFGDDDLELEALALSLELELLNFAA